MKFWRKPFDQEEKATKAVRIAVNRDRCKGCRYCVEFCPTGALVMSQEMNTKGYLLPMQTEDRKCLGCGLCEAICPDFAIGVISDSGEE